MNLDKELLQVKGLSVHIGELALITDVSFSLGKNQCLGIVGESGSGKSTLALSLVGMVGQKGEAKISGEIIFDDKSIYTHSNEDFEKLRGREISVILQDPMSSLNPVFSIGNQLEEIFTGLDKSDIKQKVIQALESVHIPAPEKRLQDYPHQMSGGMRQRIVGAMGISTQPQLLIADEPTTSLDASLQAQYLQLLKELQNKAADSERPLSILLITHDFGAVAKLCDVVAVMYGGSLVELAEVTNLFDNAAHPYTKALMESRPSLRGLKDSLKTIEGSPPKPNDVIPGCRFSPRCTQVTERCREEKPVLSLIATDHQVACWNPVRLKQKGSNQTQDKQSGVGS